MRYRLLVGLVLLAAMLVVPVLATSLNFQNADDMFGLTYSNTSDLNGDNDGYRPFYVHSSSAENNYLQWCGRGGDSIIIQSNPNYMTYAAFDYKAGTDSMYHDPSFFLYDLGGTMFQEYNFNRGSASYFERLEVKIIGGTPYYFRNNVFMGTGANIDSNPAFIGIGDSYHAGASCSAFWIDNVVWDDNNVDTGVLGLPESNDEYYVILEDVANPAASGIAFGNNHTIVQSNYLYGTVSRGIISVDGDLQQNETIQLVNYLTGAVYATNYTGDSSAAANKTQTVAIDAKTLVIDTTAPDGLYALYMPDRGIYSNLITKESAGGTITFDSDTYNRGETATLAYNIESESAYWDLSTYSYSIAIYDGLTGLKVLDEAMPTHTGTTTYTFQTGDNLGLYYAAIVATANVGGVQYWFAADVAELSAFLTFYGYVNAAETALPIQGAEVTIGQYATSTIYNGLTDDTGYYTTLGVALQSGLSTTFNATAEGYSPYLVTAVTAGARQRQLNFTLNSTSPPTYSGIAIGGVAREGMIDNEGVVTNGYGDPISGATVYVYNTTTNETYTTTTNSAGWYLCDNGALCYLVNARPYIVQSNKSGYNPSPTYPVTVTGVF